MKFGNSEQEMIDRYVWDVIRRLPVSQRKDIEMELRSLIEDMAEEEQYDSIEDVLRKLGKPAELAGQYRGGKQYIIGPEYFEQYVFVLKIVVIVNLAFSLFGTMVKELSNMKQYDHIVDGIIKFCVDFFAHAIEESMISTFGAFGVITFIFAVIEYFKLDVDIVYELNIHVEPKDLKKRFRKDSKQNDNWEPSGLLPVPSPKTLIKRSDTIFEIVFVSILCWLFIVMPEFLGFFGKVNGKIKAVPVFNLDIWDEILPFLILAMAMSLIHSIVKLMMGRYGSVVSLSCILTNTISFVSTVIVFKMYPIWNSNFFEELEQVLGRTITSKGDIFYYIGTDSATNATFLVMFVIAMAEIAVTVYKGRLGESV